MIILNTHFCILTKLLVLSIDKVAFREINIDNQKFNVDITLMETF